MMFALFELQANNATQYLNDRGIGCKRVTELGGGVSNTVLLVETGDQRLVLKQALGKLLLEGETIDLGARR